MTESYLDITKSVLISSPAGSGKTEKLARRYIALLQNGSDVERILAITFTEKAAAEMKERILNILRAEDTEMFNSVRDKMPRMRISTIHSFCLKLLKRFSIEIGMDPSLEVMDSFNADILWSEAIYESLLEDGLSGEKLFYEIIRDKGVKGWNKLYNILQELHAGRPNIELGIRGLEAELVVGSSALPVSPSEAGKLLEGGKGSGQIDRIMTIYSKCLDRYRSKKLGRHFLDYDDLELLTYEAISKNPEWQNILFSFDEHTDHILVDEFQDTSSLQWKIIDKLTEEWRSGLGSKRDSGVKPSIFLVGDDKQSIYSFRGANVSIFKNARRHLSEWLGDEYHFIEEKENYRSLPGIVNFVNTLFKKLMTDSLFDDWKIEYTPFESTRQAAPGAERNVELLLLESDGTIRDARKAEASAIAQRIKEFYGRYEIYDGKTTRECNYGDMAILLRSRTHLTVFEEELRRADIPFVVVKGIGFYHTPEVSILKNLLFFLIDPHDDYSLFNILRSPLFNMDYGSLFRIMQETASHNSSYGQLYSSLKALLNGGADGGLLQGKLWAEDYIAKDMEKLRSVLSFIDDMLGKSKDVSYSIMMEEVLNDSETWQHLHEKQRYLNTKKFIRLVEDLETRGLTGLEIRENLIKASMRADEQKANVNPEGMNAIRVMTIHASKGLQFPVVFLPCLDEESKVQGSAPIVLDEEGGRIVLGYEDDPEIRKNMPLFRRHREKAQEEEKRLFYVGVTRTMDYLCMSGVLRRGKISGKLGYLAEAFNIDSDSEFLKIKRIASAGTEAPLSSQQAPQPFYISSGSSLQGEIISIEPIDRDYRPSFTWLDVTEEIDSVRRKHGDDWVILGRAFHRLFEGLSNSTITIDTIVDRILFILRNEAAPDRAISTMRKIIMSDVQRLKESDYLDKIVFPRDNSYSELPFILQKGNRIYRGRIDRVIVRDNTASIYDYKTYPVSEAEIPELKERYSFQMKIYKEATEELFSIRSRAYLFFTHESMIVEI